MAYNPSQILLAVQYLRPELRLGDDFTLADLGDGNGPFISVWNRPDVPQPTQAEIEAVDTDALLNPPRVLRDYDMGKTIAEILES